MSEISENESKKTIARLRKEYDNYLRQAKKLYEYGKREIAHLLSKKLFELEDHEKVKITGRIKTFDKCLIKLTREAGYIPEDASIFSVEDIIGLRIAVFPNSIIRDIQEIIDKEYPSAERDHRREPYRLQYYVNIEELGISNNKVEIQVMPYLLGSYWDVEHGLYDSMKYGNSSEKWRETRLAIIEGEMAEKIINVSSRLSDIVLGKPISPTIRLVNLTYIILELNALLDSGNYGDISIEEVEKEISNETVLEYIAERGGDDIDLSLILGREHRANDFIKMYNIELKNILEAYKGDERRKWGIQNSGIHLLIAWTNEIIQRGNGWEPNLTF